MTPRRTLEEVHLRLVELSDHSMLVRNGELIPYVERKPDRCGTAFVIETGYHRNFTFRQQTRQKVKCGFSFVIHFLQKVIQCVTLYKSRITKDKL
jgi:hypothetical protein